ncbi:KH domain-containing protein [Sarocladium implicatum]|nr:KH domain-containing protein [Sarocladium implicatum]
MTASADPVYVLPGDEIDPELIPSHPKKALRLGPGLRHVAPNDLLPTLAGQLVTDRQKNLIRVETSGGRYVPRVGELVIGTVQRSTADAYFVTLTDYTSPALLPHLSFESATKKTRPILAPGALVYARVTLAHRHMDPEIECVSSSTGKADGLGPLNGGMLFSISQGMARRLMMPKGSGLVILEELGSAGLQFETATGRNGKFWVDSTSVQTIIAVGRAVQETDEKRLGVDDQKKAVKKIIKDLS